VDLVGLLRWFDETRDSPTDRWDPGRRAALAHHLGIITQALSLDGLGTSPRWESVGEGLDYMEEERTVTVCGLYLETFLKHPDWPIEDACGLVVECARRLRTGSNMRLQTETILQTIQTIAERKQLTNHPSIASSGLVALLVEVVSVASVLAASTVHDVSGSASPPLVSSQWAGSIQPDTAMRCLQSLMRNPVFLSGFTTNEVLVALCQVIGLGSGPYLQPTLELTTSLTTHFPGALAHVCESGVLSVVKDCYVGKLGPGCETVAVALVENMRDDPTYGAGVRQFFELEEAAVHGTTPEHSPSTSLEHSHDPLN